MSCYNRDMEKINLRHMEYRKQQKKLVCASEYFGGRFPNEIAVTSHITGREIIFSVVIPEDPLFDQDQWDGEQQVYRPNEHIRNVESLVIYHAY